MNNFIEKYSETNMLLVFMNCYHIINHEKKSFSKMILQILDNTKNLKIILVSDTFIKKKNKIYEHCSVVELTLLNKKHAAELLKSYDHKNLLLQHYNIDTIAEHKLFNPV